MKKIILILTGVMLGTCTLYAGSPEMDEMKRQYELEQQKCQEYGGGKNAVYKGNTYGSSTETKGPTNTYKGGAGVGASVGTSTKGEGNLNFDYSRTGSQENKSDNSGNRWECE